MLRRHRQRQSTSNQHRHRPCQLGRVKKAVLTPAAGSPLTCGAPDEPGSDIPGASGASRIVPKMPEFCLWQPRETAEIHPVLAIPCYILQNTALSLQLPQPTADPILLILLLILNTPRASYRKFFGIWGLPVGA
ncbi:hypothetical protein ig2599ANME_0325 [groundwater metagenome]